MTTNDPWKSLSASAGADTANARRVDASGRWNFFWAKDEAGRYLLLLEYRSRLDATVSLPKLHGIEVSLQMPVEGGSGQLMIRLLDSSLRDIFHELCNSILASASQAGSEPDAISRAVARTWRWHHLLRGGSSTLLSAEEQKGLIGELITLDRHFLPVMSAYDALLAWIGPTDAPKDFEIGLTAVEVKTRRAGAVSAVSISSEHQLDDAGLDRLFLHVVNLSEAQATHPQARSLNDFALAIRTRIEGMDQGAVALLDERLQAAGFRWEDDYAAFLWVEGQLDVFDVREGFPRVTPDSCLPGVSRVKYTVALSECHEYALSEESIRLRLRGR
ncbi:PD-(D/E)XK motif protein [Rhizobium leguminosarum]|uniref:PD-(D/E)XK motif protein n=1 Tax=Rhizobium ruizarguesonis TaxID=2081791 RepID=UPI00103BDC0D|nr:PD-(D/E)XK motif protein [Rhizobium ruizarguesonis]MBY5807643.1 PD-(D/E)XK motif protein [Rhizobium leguminosarum]TCB12994.1 PD-(D/E)XK motif protein [Rhizobium leguminosarum bv. viciae]MBY5848223.1 PD-(D/E)XK motif protein [Rhizobium leguminosarum]NEH88634.1 PD-(D/E)XK motif protein [Rhizobium ruizarguesonis]NEI17597.1 PD-(D/E)XK motif protein [Rhizobium ruizarguesonis]